MSHTEQVPLSCHRSVASPTTDAPQSQVGENVAGALIFFSYIAAALIFIGLIVGAIGRRANENVIRKSEVTAQSCDGRRLGNARQNIKHSTTVGRKARADVRIIFPGLALASFSLLSWNMLNFLLTSYLQWTDVHGIPATFDVATLSQIRRHLLYIWQWSTSANLVRVIRRRSSPR